jgi:hypothetical protein
MRFDSRYHRGGINGATVLNRMARAPGSGWEAIQRRAARKAYQKKAAYWAGSIAGAIAEDVRLLEPYVGVERAKQLVSAYWRREIP